MKTITKQELLENKDFYIKEILDGKIFIYPTDTIYGIGCNAKNANSITKIREIKQRDEKPMSVIIPSKNWAYENCEIPDKKELEKLPGPYTFIAKLKKEENIAKKELIGDLEGLGIRIPDNWFTEMITNTGEPFVTTSVNISGEPHLTNPDDLKRKIKRNVDYLIDDGILSGKPSTIINLMNQNEIIRK